MILQPDMPFIWGSGWTSPIYNDNRRILSYPDVRNYVKIEMAKNILESYGDATVVAAVSTVAIPIASIVADSLGLPMIFVRATPKDHGLENLIEGKLRPGQKVVLVEDTISTGGSTLKAADIVRDAGSEVLGAVSGAGTQSTEQVSVTVTIPPGGELRIDSDTFRVLLNGENVLDKQSGDWLMLSRDLLYLDIESAIGNGLSGNLIYTERYL